MDKNKLIDFYQTHKLYIFPAVVALSSLFLIAYAIYPQATKLLTNQKAAADLTKRSKLLEEKITALESYDAEDLSKKVEYALKSYPAEKDYVDILGLLQDLSKSSGFEISSVSFAGDSGKSTNTSSYLVKLQAKGVKSLLQALLNKLESSSRILRVKSVDISSNQVSQAIDVSLAVEVLYSALPQDTGTEETLLPQITQKEEELLLDLARADEPVSFLTATQSATIASPKSLISTASSSLKGKSNPFD